MPTETLIVSAERDEIAAAANGFQKAASWSGPCLGRRNRLSEIDFNSHHERKSDEAGFTEKTADSRAA